MLKCFYCNDGALAAYDTHGGASRYFDGRSADGSPHVAVNLDIAILFRFDGFRHTSRTPQQRIGIAWFVGLVLVQVA